MPANKQCLELTWIGKEVRPTLEPRILLGDQERSYHAKYRVKEGSHEVTKATKLDAKQKILRAFVSSCETNVGGIFDNLLIHGDNLLALKELEQEDAGKVKAAFDTPKPEFLLHRILHISTNPGDIVLDSFLGSGTTAAVAHKMGRRWIGIELGEHCHTHCIPRLKKVIDGEDPGGITEAVGWKGGGGFRYYRLAPSLLEKDKWGNWVISKESNKEMLAEALCKLEGFTYAPSDTVYWQHGHSTERDFIYVTTANLKHVQLQQLSDEVGPDRSLLVVCPSFRGNAEGYPNLTVKKIPKAVLNRCEWGKDDYSLRVENLPKAPPKEGQQELGF